MLFTSQHELTDMLRNLTNSVLLNLEKPSAILFITLRDALTSCSLNLN